MPKIKLLYFFIFILISSTAAAQWNPPPPPTVDPPGVPIDGGLTALLVAGGAMGYRAMKKKNEEL